MKLLTILIFIGIFLSPLQKINANSTNPEAKITISGYIKDKSNGEELVGAAVYVNELKTGAVTNMYGYYSVSLPAGNYTLVFSYIGFQNLKKEVELKSSITLNIELQVEDAQLQEVVVNAEKKNENITKPVMSVVKMEMKTIKQIPALMGEVDVIKAIQLLPGVQSTSEGSSGYSVRGGSSDQNLILLDEATVYNASHLLGFFSVFNNDAVKDIELYKGDIPAAYGGRLSSLLDVRMKKGDSKKITGRGGIGTISSRFTLEGPLFRDSTSFILSGRRTYIDLFLPLASNKEIRNNKLYFYDLNLKLNHKINANNTIYLAGYFGQDVFRSSNFEMGFGNQTATLRWNHLFSSRLFANTTLIYSKYTYHLGTAGGEANSFIWRADLHDYCAKIDFNYFLNNNNTIKFGYLITRHKIEPGSAKGVGEKSMFSEYKVPENKAIEHGFYVSNEQKVSERLNLKYGLRYSIFQNYGSATIYNFDANYQAKDSTFYPSWDFFNTYGGFEPRLGLTFTLNSNSSIKASYSRTMQYMQLAQNSTGGTPLDIWYPCSPNVKPQIGDQVAAGYFHNFNNNTIETSVEFYYKKMNNAIDFKDHAMLLLNRKLEGELRFGEATAYGAEFMVKLNLEKLNGWVSYTYSKAERKIVGINDGNPYPAPYDKPHSINVVMTYDLTKRASISANWVYSTGSPVTFPTGRFEYAGKLAPVYSNRNAYRMPDYHRLDVAFNLKSKVRPGRKWHGEWNFSLYNAYSRKNAWAISFLQDEQDPTKTYAEKTYLFPIIPSVTYNFYF